MCPARREIAGTRFRSKCRLILQQAATIQRLRLDTMPGARLPVMRFGITRGNGAIDEQRTLTGQQRLAADLFQERAMIGQRMLHDGSDGSDAARMVFRTASLQKPIKPWQQMWQMPEPQMQRPKRVEQHARQPLP